MGQWFGWAGQSSAAGSILHINQQGGGYDAPINGTITKIKTNSDGSYASWRFVVYRKMNGTYKCIAKSATFDVVFGFQEHNITDIPNVQAGDVIGICTNSTGHHAIGTNAGKNTKYKSDCPAVDWEGGLSNMGGYSVAVQAWIEPPPTGDITVNAQDGEGSPLAIDIEFDGVAQTTPHTESGITICNNYVVEVMKTKVGNIWWCFDQWSDGNTNNPRTFHCSGDATITIVMEYCSCSEQDNQIGCEAAGCYWWGGTCHDVPEPSGEQMDGFVCIE